MKDKLNFDLQLFSDKEADTQLSENEEKEETKEVEKTFTQEELDEIIKNRLARERNNFEKEIKEKIAQEKEEAERLAKLSAEERAKEIAKQKDEELKNARAELNRVLLENDTIARLTEERLPASFKNIVIGQDAESTNENIKVLKSEFEKAVQEAVEEKLKGKTPRVANSTSANKNPWRKENFNLTKQGIIMRENPELAQQLINEARGE